MDTPGGLDVGQIISAARGDTANKVSTWVYVTCRLMAARGLLEYKGMSTMYGQPDYFVYHDPRTDDIYAVQRPAIGAHAEDMLMDRMVDLATTRYLPV